MSAKRHEEWVRQKVVDEAGERLVAQAATVSVAQAEKELAEAGFDVEAEGARADAFLESLEAGAATEGGGAEGVAWAVPREAPTRAGRSTRAMRRPAATWVAAAVGIAAVAAGVAVTYVAARPERAISTTTTTTASASTRPAVPTPQLTAAVDRRRRAAVACDEGRVDECRSLLDQAAAMDPPGDTMPEVQRLRHTGPWIGTKPR